MKIEKLKPLVKAILMELYNKKLLKEGSGTLDNHEIQLEGLVIPGLTTEDDLVIVDVNIDYETSPDIPARGMFGPPEKSSPAESGDFSVMDFNIGAISIQHGENRPEQYDIKQLTPPQLMVLKKAVDEYIENNQDEFEQAALDKASDEVDYGGDKELEDYDL